MRFDRHQLSGGSRRAPRLFFFTDKGTASSPWLDAWSGTAMLVSTGSSCT
jgi:hypothetical protein